MYVNTGRFSTVYRLHSANAYCFFLARSVFQCASHFLAPPALGGKSDRPPYAPHMRTPSLGCVTATCLLAEHNSSFRGMLNRNTDIAEYSKRPAHCHRVIRPRTSHSILRVLSSMLCFTRYFPAPPLLYASANSYEPTVQHQALENACYPRKPDPISNSYLSSPRPKTVDSSFPLTSWHQRPHRLCCPPSRKGGHGRHLARIYILSISRTRRQTLP
jgi:hypothetical protein